MYFFVVGLGWIGLALVITSLHLFNMTLLLPDLTQVIDGVLQVFFACYEGILLLLCFFLLADVILSLSLSHMLTRYTLERIDISQLYQGESDFFFSFLFLFIYISTTSFD